MRFRDKEKVPVKNGCVMMHYVWKSWVIRVLLVLLPFVAKAETDHDLEIKLETIGVTGTGDFAPFWHTSNRQGLASVQKKNGYMHAAAIGVFYMPMGFNLSYGTDIGIGAGLENDLFLHQLYTDLNYKWLGVSIGMKERWSDKNPMLSSGALAWSGNSKPIPELRAGISEYVRVPILDNWFSVKGHIGYGRFTDDKWRKNRALLSSNIPQYADGILFHSKDLYIRVGNPARFPLQGYIGLEMNTIFGGKIYNQYHDDVYYDEYELPSGSQAFIAALLPFNKAGEQGNDNGDIVGSWHLGLDYTINDWHFRTYYEHFFEDHSSMLGIEYKNNAEGKKGFIFYGFRRNWFDGLFGLEVNAPNGIRFFRNAVFEYLNTKGQTGPILHSGVTYNPEVGQVVEEIDGRDGMYNHVVYGSYTHWGFAIGSPVLISPVYNEDGSICFRSNRVQMFHLGLDGGITSSIDYRILATTTQHWGQYGDPLKEVERVTSVMVECSYKFGGEYGWRVSLSGAADFDSGSDGFYLLGNNKGVMFTVSKAWKVL